MLLTALHFLLMLLRLKITPKYGAEVLPGVPKSKKTVCKYMLEKLPSGILNKVS